MSVSFINFIRCNNVATNSLTITNINTEAKDMYFNKIVVLTSDSCGPKVLRFKHAYHGLDNPIVQSYENEVQGEVRLPFLQEILVFTKCYEIDYSTAALYSDFDATTAL